MLSGLARAVTQCGTVYPEENRGQVPASAAGFGEVRRSLSEGGYWHSVLVGGEAEGRGSSRFSGATYGSALQHATITTRIITARSKHQRELSDAE